MNQVINTPIGERLVDKFIYNIFREVPTAPKKETIIDAVWFEENGRMVTIVKRKKSK